MKQTDRSTIVNARVNVSPDTVVEENLPLRFVHYPGHYGTFLAFAEAPGSPPALCGCSKGAVSNYVRLRSLHPKVYDKPRPTVLDEYDFPTTIVQASGSVPKNPLARLVFKDGVCHRCNQATPSLWFCHPMYDKGFKLRYGWYAHQACFLYGVDRVFRTWLPNITPLDVQHLLRQVDEATSGFALTAATLDRTPYWPPTDWSPEEKARWTDAKKIEIERFLVAQRQSLRARRELDKYFENIARDWFGFRKVGEAWVSETLLYRTVCRLLPGREVLFHHRPDWLAGLELDVFVPSLNIAFEYQGAQHYQAVSAWGGEEALGKLKIHDMEKGRLCSRRGIRLVEVPYTSFVDDALVTNHLAEGSTHS